MSNSIQNSWQTLYGSNLYGLSVSHSLLLIQQISNLKLLIHFNSCRPNACSGDSYSSRLPHIHAHSAWPGIHVYSMGRGPSNPHPDTSGSCLLATGRTKGSSIEIQRAPSFLLLTSSAWEPGGLDIHKVGRWPWQYWQVRPTSLCVWGP